MYKLNDFEQKIDAYASSFKWTNFIGIARTLVALGTLVTLCFNDMQNLLLPVGKNVYESNYLALSKGSLFYLLGEHLFLAKVIAVTILLVVASGWRPRVTGVFHWWVTYSITSSAIVLDGGDQISEILTLFLIPICLCDPRKWHWQNFVPKTYTEGQKIGNLIAGSTLMIIRLQVAFIYFHAGVGKFAVDEWVNGTAVYYWLNDGTFGMADWFRPIMSPLLQNSISVTAMTWGVLLIEISMFLGLTMQKKWHPYLLRVGLFFHVMIILCHGLVSFFFAMSCGLFLFLGSRDGYSFQWVLRFRDTIQKVFKSRRVKPAVLSPELVS